MLDLEPINPVETEASSTAASEDVLEDEQGRQDRLLVALLFSTPPDRLDNRNVFEARQAVLREDEPKDRDGLRGPPESLSSTYSSDR